MAVGDPFLLYASTRSDQLVSIPLNHFKVRWPNKKLNDDALPWGCWDYLEFTAHRREVWEALDDALTSFLHEYEQKAPDLIPDVNVFRRDHYMPTLERFSYAVTVNFPLFKIQFDDACEAALLLVTRPRISVNGTFCSTRVYDANVCVEHPNTRCVLKGSDDKVKWTRNETQEQQLRRMRAMRSLTYNSDFGDYLEAAKRVKI